MNRDDIIRMAQDAGMTPISHVSTADVICSRTSLERFANLVAAAEREACAQTVESIAGDEQYRWAALAIRERGAP